MPRRRSLEPRKTPQQPRSTATQARILHAAGQVFSEWGYAAGTTNRIAKQAGLSIGSLYQYFPNKDAILAALMRAHVHNGVAIVAARFADPDLPRDLRGQIRSFVLAAVANHQGDPRLHQVLFEQAPRDAAVLAELRAFEDATIAATGKLLASHPEVRVGDPHTAATVTFATIESLTHHFIANSDQRLPADVFVDETVHLVHRYLTCERH